MQHACNMKSEIKICPAPSSERLILRLRVAYVSNKAQTLGFNISGMVNVVKYFDLWCLDNGVFRKGRGGQLSRATHLNR